MKAYKFFLPVLFLSLIVNSICAVSVRAEEQPTKRPRPRIGLVLEGGGAKGFAHVGVLKVLEENRVPIDYVAGTSMGSIVAAAYASGVPVDEMEAILSSTDWDALFNENPPRAEIPYRFKPGRNREIFGSGKIGLSKDGVVLPAGLITGQQVLPVLQRLFGKVPSPINFDKLHIPFRAVAADLLTGAPYVPTEGDVASVVRASMSVPGFFSPMKIGDRYLVDGGIVDNLPVELTRSMGAEILIVVALISEPTKIEDLASPLSISGHVVSLMLEQNSSRSKALVRPTDLYIAPFLKTYSATDFAHAKEIMAIGEEKARSMVNDIRRLSISPEEFASYSERRTVPLQLRRP